MRSSRGDGLVGHTSYGHRIYFVLLGDTTFYKSSCWLLFRSAYLWQGETSACAEIYQDRLLACSKHAQ